ncbi:protein sister of odd and bowel-like isoform X18 [Mizuhopecten yessoensis]|uniref:protein sister of odd and bowel-like isoform X18 n=1 Tax=Mizuhopecten yessoensis TaxID=6573 RepID=UPI000B45A035|nr:protein sister of odd and bowel-like isoform X18 [Mizuhopecten yessoensis]
MNYQKFYTNGIHSSSLLCQLATMWKSQTLCDAIIKTGNINTKAHRLVLVAACPMLQSMDNASIGSHLEVRLASEIKQDSVNMFLQYLYEGFMMLTEDNHKDIEKIARLLQVDSVIKCCADFCKSLHEKTGLSIYSAGQFKYTSHDMLEFKHVRVSGMQKTVQDSMMKRHSDFQRPNSPGSKRPRMHRPGSPSDGQRGDNMYGHSSHSDSDRVPRLGLGSFPGAAGRNLQPGVIEVIEDSLELVQTEPVERDPVTGRPLDSRPPVQKTVAISVASQVTGGDPDLQIVNVSGVRDSSSSSTSRTHLSTATHTTSTPIARDSRGSSAHSSFSSQQSSQSMRSDIPMTSSSRVSTERAMPQMPRPDIQRSMQNQFASDLLQQQQKQSTSQYPSIPQALIDMDFTANKQKSSDVFPTSLQKATDVFPTSMPKPSDIVFPGMPMGSQQNSTPMAQSKPFAAGSAGQANQSVPVHINTSSSSSSPITSLPPVSPVIPEASLFGLSASSPSSKSSQPTTSRSESMERPSSSERLKEERPPTAADLIGPDISIVKIESTDKDETGVLDMYVDTGDDGEVHPHGMEGEGDQTYEGSDYDVEEPPGEMEGSNEGSNLSGDQNAWYLNTMKGGTQGGLLPLIAQGSSGDADLQSQHNISWDLNSSRLHSSSPSQAEKYKDLSNVDLQTFLCKFCLECFVDKGLYERHLIHVHGLDIVAFCPECDKTFKSWSGYNMHVKMHNKSSCPKCSYCEKVFQSNAHLQIHMRSHSAVKPFVCLSCGKSYKHKKDLNTHVCYKTKPM